MKLLSKEDTVQVFFEEMKKTLYIQIDKNSLPKGCGEEIEILDCTCTNDFCSMAGDALVSDLKGENGRPLYRLINPVGRLLIDFKTVNEEAFNGLISMWYDYLGELLHKGKLESDLMIRFPQTYIDWLLQNDNTYYNNVGKELHNKNGAIFVPSEDVIDDIMASLTYKINNFLQEKKDDISFVVFSNPLIRNSSFVVKRVKLNSMEFLRYESWRDNIKGSLNRHICEVKSKEKLSQTNHELQKEINLDFSFYDSAFSRKSGYFYEEACSVWYGNVRATRGSFVFHCKKILWLIGITDEDIIDNTVCNKSFSFFEKTLLPFGFKSHSFDDEQYYYKKSLEFICENYLIIFGFTASKSNVINFETHPMSLSFIVIYRGKDNFYKKCEYCSTDLYFTDINGEKVFHKLNVADRIEKIVGNISYYG